MGVMIGIYIYKIKAINIHKNNAIYYCIILVLGDLKTIEMFQIGHKIHKYIIKQFKLMF